VIYALAAGMGHLWAFRYHFGMATGGLRNGRTTDNERGKIYSEDARNKSLPFIIAFVIINLFSLLKTKGLTS
jgi:hypothetical protein